MTKLAENEAILDELSDVEIPEDFMNNPDFGEYLKKIKKARSSGPGT